MPVAAGRPCLQHLGGDLEQRALGEVADQTRVGPVIHDHRRDWRAPRVASSAFSSRIRI